MGQIPFLLYNRVRALKRKKIEPWYVHTRTFKEFTGYTQDRPARSVSFGYLQDNANQ